MYVCCCRHPVCLSVYCYPASPGHREHVWLGERDYIYSFRKYGNIILAGWVKPDGPIYIDICFFFCFCFGTLTAFATWELDQGLLSQMEWLPTLESARNKYEIHPTNFVGKQTVEFSYFSRGWVRCGHDLKNKSYNSLPPTPPTTFEKYTTISRVP